MIKDLNLYPTINFQHDLDRKKILSLPEKQYVLIDHHLSISFEDKEYINSLKNELHHQHMEQTYVRLRK